MFQDLRFGVRMLLKQPGFTLIAVLTLSLGIGATSAVFSLIKGVLLTPPPYPKPEQLMLISSARTNGQQTPRPPDWAAAQWMEWQKETTSFDSIAAYRWSFNFLVMEDGSESLEGMWVTRDYFRVAGLQPVLGRTFLDSDIGANTPPVIILGYDLWQPKFNGDPNIVGKTIRLWQRQFGGDPNLIGQKVNIENFGERQQILLGVMPPEFDFPPRTEVWFPYVLTPGGTSCLYQGNCYGPHRR